MGPKIVLAEPKTRFYDSAPAVRVQAARVPIMAGAAPPPVYPGNQLSNLEKYDI